MQERTEFFNNVSVNLRWLLLDYVDPQFPLTAAERRKVRERTLTLRMDPAVTLRVRRISPQAYRRVMIFQFVQTFTPATFLLGPYLIAQMLWPLSGMQIMLLYSVGLVAAWPALTWFGRWAWRPAVNAALREIGYDICEHCGYWRNGLEHADTPCPECGTRPEPAE